MKEFLFLHIFVRGVSLKVQVAFCKGGWLKGLGGGGGRGGRHIFKSIQSNSNYLVKNVEYNGEKSVRKSRKHGINSLLEIEKYYRFDFFCVQFLFKGSTFQF